MRVWSGLLLPSARPVARRAPCRVVHSDDDVFSTGSSAVHSPLRGRGGSAVICKKDSRRSRAINITPFHEPSACLFPLAPGRARLALPFRRSRLSLPAIRTRSRSICSAVRKDSLSCFRSWKNRGVHFLVSAVWDGTLYSRNHTRLWVFLSRLLPLLGYREIYCRVT